MFFDSPASELAENVARRSGFRTVGGITDVVDLAKTPAGTGSFGEIHYAYTSTKYSDGPYSSSMNLSNTSLSSASSAKTGAGAGELSAARNGAERRF